jgi:addiction module RelE/StbE family toxin
VNVRWVDSAEQDRLDIWEHISSDNPEIAVKMDETFSETAARLADFPLFGQNGQIKGTREIFPHKNYRMVYEIEGETVWTLAIVHTSRQWPSTRTDRRQNAETD